MFDEKGRVWITSAVRPPYLVSARPLRYPSARFSARRASQHPPYDPKARADAHRCVSHASPHVRGGRQQYAVDQRRWSSWLAQHRWADARRSLRGWTSSWTRTAAGARLCRADRPVVNETRRQPLLSGARADGLSFGDPCRHAGRRRAPLPRDPRTALAEIMQPPLTSKNPGSRRAAWIDRRAWVGSGERQLRSAQVQGR